LYELKLADEFNLSSVDMMKSLTRI